MHVLIDTEGIDALDANNTHDVRILTLALLLSATFLHNSHGASDETALQTLHLILTRVVERVKQRADDGEVRCTSTCPAFCWFPAIFRCASSTRAAATQHDCTLLPSPHPS